MDKQKMLDAVSKLYDVAKEHGIQLDDVIVTIQSYHLSDDERFDIYDEPWVELMQYEDGQVFVEDAAILHREYEVSDPREPVVTRRIEIDVEI